MIAAHTSNSPPASIYNLASFKIKALESIEKSFMLLYSRCYVCTRVPFFLHEGKYRFMILKFCWMNDLGKTNVKLTAMLMLMAVGFIHSSHGCLYTCIYTHTHTHTHNWTSMQNNC